MQGCDCSQTLQDQKRLDRYQELSARSMAVLRSASKVSTAIPRYYINWSYPAYLHMYSPSPNMAKLEEYNIGIFMDTDYMNNGQKWYKRAYEQRYGKGSWNGHNGNNKLPEGMLPYQSDAKRYWDRDKAVGIVEEGGKYIGIACLAAKEVSDRESYVAKFGLSFDKDIQWRAISSLLDHLSRGSLFKAVLITSSNIPFELKPDIPDELEGRLNWAKRNYEMHKAKAESLNLNLEKQNQSISGFGGPFPNYLPKQIKEENDHARKFLDTAKTIESERNQHLKQYFQIKENLFAVALFFYIYTEPKNDIEAAINEITSRKYSLKMEIAKTYFVSCTDVKEPEIIFNPEFYPFFRESQQYFCIALAKDCAGFSSDKDVAIALRKMFTIVLELPKETEIEEQMHMPSNEVSIEGFRKAYIGHVMSSVVKNMALKRRVYFPIDILTSHALILGRTRGGKYTAPH